MAPTVLGKYNSSITRVRPFFWKLLAQDAMGNTWLPPLLAAAPRGQEWASNCGAILPGCLERRPYTDKVWRQQIRLEACFEREAPPPVRFLEWLIRHPLNLTWPAKWKCKEETRVWRERLLGMHGDGEMERAMKTALAGLRERGAAGSRRRWWSFEGFTSVDCCLETDRLVLFVEGKRTEPLAVATEWYPWRSQLLRNLETAAELAHGKQFAVLVLAEQRLPDLSPQDIAAGLPHLRRAERASLLGHYLGCLLWPEACEATGISYASLPYTRAAAATESTEPVKT